MCICISKWLNGKVKNNGKLKGIIFVNKFIAVCWHNNGNWCKENNMLGVRRSFMIQWFEWFKWWELRFWWDNGHFNFFFQIFSITKREEWHQTYKISYFFLLLYFNRFIKDCLQVLCGFLVVFFFLGFFGILRSFLKVIWVFLVMVIVTITVIVMTVILR
jgi:hypothetical protein